MLVILYICKILDYNMEIISSVSKMGETILIRIPKKYHDQLLKDGFFNAEIRGHPALRIILAKYDK